MNNSGAIVDMFGKLLDRFPKEFFEKHPVLAIGGCVSIVALPYVGAGIKDINDSWVAAYRFKIAAENGLIEKKALETSKVILLDEDTAA